MKEFKDNVVLVTGATSGIGRDAALCFAKQGAKVAISGRREKEGAEVVELINAAGGQGFFFKGDVAVEEECAAMAAAVEEHFGAIQHCFANAGVWGDPQTLVDETVENIDYVIDVNVKGVLYTIKHVAPKIVARGGGSIVTNSSILGLRAMPGYSVYVASKFAVIGITKTAALELAEQQVRVNCIAPGPIETDMLQSASGGDTSGFKKMVPMKKVGEPEDISATLLWLCSKGAKYVSGQVLAVDGGFTAK